MTRPDPTNHQAAHEAANDFKRTRHMSRNEDHSPEVERLNAALRDVRNFADLLVGEGDQDDPNYRDAAREAAGRQLHNILNAAGVPK